MTEALHERIEAEFIAALDEITAADLGALVRHIERFGLGGELDAVIRTARPGATVQRRFLPAHTQGTIFKAALRTEKAVDLLQDCVVGLYADELGDAVEDPTLAQLQEATDVVLGLTSAALVKLTLIGVVHREEVAAPHAIVVLRDAFACDLTK